MKIPRTYKLHRLCILLSNFPLVRLGLIIYFIYGIHNSVEGKKDDHNSKDKVELIMPPPPDKMYDMKQIQPENRKKTPDFDRDSDDEPRYVEN